MLTLASASRTRQKILTDAAIPHVARPARVDEAAVKEALLAAGHSPREVADALAELKALHPKTDGLILGCDQVLDNAGTLLSKPNTPEAALAQLTMLVGSTHELHTAAVIVENGAPIWRHVESVKMTMRRCSPAYLHDYVSRNWETIHHSAGSYALEGEGARLFHRVEGDYFTVLGLPLLPLIDFLANRGDLPV